MTLRQELRPWSGQPQEVVQVANGLRPIGVWLASLGNNLVRPSFVDPAYRNFVVTRPAGKVWQFVGAGAGVPLLPASVGLPTQTATIILKAYRITAGKRVDWGVADSSDATKRCGGHIPFTDGTVYFDFGGATSGSTRVSVSGLTFSPSDTWAFSVGARGMEIWQNGRLVASNSATPTRSASADNWGLGTHGGTTSSADEQAQWEAAALFDTQLPPSLIAALTRDFYGTILEPQELPMPYTAASGVSGTFSATLNDDTIAASGAAPNNSTGSFSLAGDTLSASGTTTLLASAAFTLAGDTISASGTTTVLSSAAFTLGGDTMSASGAVGNNTNGTAAFTLNGDTISASGTVTVTSSAAFTLDGVTISASGTTTVLSTAAFTLAGITMSAHGSGGTSSFTFPACAIYVGGNIAIGTNGQPVVIIF